MIEETDIRKLAKLARLELSEHDVMEMRGHLESMLAYMESLRRLDLSAVEPMSGVEEQSGFMRPDVEGESLSAQWAFRNAPRAALDHFVIPKVIG